MADAREEEGGVRPQKTKRTWAERVALIIPLVNLLVAIHKIAEEWILPYV
ncbi:hypothetical protein G3I40_10290 [Streptomyces sp. SID14478]|nr:hypothetical protein [Streptomyces sp. SID14478]NEB75612.1 hypothetical protein [Streptomyces sp. SID14478]